MSILFLGSAQDGGIPQTGCDCHNCRSVEMTASSIAIINDDKSIIFDITPDFRKQYRQLSLKGIREIEAIFLTHAHWGHYGGLMLLGKEGWNVNGVKTYLSKCFHDFLTKNEPFRSLFQDEHLFPEILHSGQITSLGITPILVPHRDEYSETFVYGIERSGKNILYAPCLDYFTNEFIDLLPIYDIIIIDGTFYHSDEIKSRSISKIPHPRISQTVKTLFAHAGKIILTHFNHTNQMINPDNIERVRLESEGFRFAFDGMELEI